MSLGRQPLASSSVRSEALRGFLDILPLALAAFPIGLLWGTLATGKGLSPAEALLTSATVFAGAAQFVALDLWRDPVPWLLLTVSVFVVNIRHVLMGASLSRHMGRFPGLWRAAAMFLMVDESWALAERRALSEPLTPAYYLGLTLPLWVNWTVSTLIGAGLGRGIGDPAAWGFDFVFTALFIAILAGFWKGPRTGAVLAASALVSALVKYLDPGGAWNIAAGGVVGVAVAAALWRREEAPA